MTSRAGPRTRLAARRGAPPEPRPGDLEDVRQVILGAERERIDRLERRPPVTSGDVGPVLPEAVAAVSSDRLDALSIALEPAMTRAVRTVARKESELFGEILSPTIGSAVRRALTDAVKAILAGINETIERRLSVRSVRWRIEAWRTGRPLEEIVLARTLIFRVEEVFLIHTETGLVLEHVSGPGPQLESPDQVAAMLSAIDSFARDVFRPMPPGSHLQQLEVGELTVWVDRDPTATVAAVVRGVGPPTLGAVLRETRERIRLAQKPELDRFVSDPAPFAAARPALEDCLLLERRRPPRRAPVVLAGAALLLVAALELLAARGAHGRAEEVRLRAEYAETLRREPGIVVSRVDRVGPSWRLEGLRDPIAEDPARLLERSGLPAAQLAFEPFVSLAPKIVERRAAQVLQPPSSVVLELDRGTLRASGVAPRAWIERAGTIAPALPGVERWDPGDLRPGEANAALESAQAALERVSIPFSRGSSKVRSPASVTQAAARVREVITAARESRAAVCIAVIGHTDRSGPEPLNQALGPARARAVAEALIEGGVPRSLLSTSVRGGTRGREVTFLVHTGLASCGGGP